MNRSLTNTALMPTLPTILLLAFTVTCSVAKKGSPTHTFRIFQENGVTIAETTGGPRYLDSLFTYTEVCRLIENEEQEESLLSRANRYFRGEDGCYYVQDNGNTRIAIFDGNGKYLRSIGQRGQGPGEYQSLAILWMQRDRIAVIDEITRRTTFLKTDGSILETYSFASFPGRPILHPASDNVVVISTRQDQYQPGKEIIRTPVALICTPQGDSLGQVQAATYSLGTLHILETVPTAMPGEIYFGGRSDILFHPSHGILSYSSAEPILRWYSSDGDLIRIIRLNLDAEPVSNEERQAIAVLQEQRIESARNEQYRELGREVSKHTIIPEMKSFWSGGVTVDDFGYIWLRYHTDYTAPADERNNARWRVISPEGEYLGDTIWPISASSVSNGHLLTYQQDEETGEVDFIVYQIQSAIQGLDYRN